MKGATAMSDADADNLPAAQPSPAPAPPAATTLGLDYRVAATCAQVVDAWQLVYLAYRRLDLIPPHPQRMHFAPQAVTPRAAVIAGAIGPLTVNTLTAIVDGADAGGPARGLPLDRLYPTELDALRQRGRRLMEVDLFADRRRQLSRVAETLFQLMRFAFYFGLSQQVTDCLIGVHPQHARFYSRALGFEPYGPPRPYPAVNHQPVVLLRGDLDRERDRRTLHPALGYFLRNPVAPAAFVARFNFAPDLVVGSPIASHLRATR